MELERRDREDKDLKAELEERGQTNKALECSLKGLTRKSNEDQKQYNQLKKYFNAVQATVSDREHEIAELRQAMANLDWHYCRAVGEIEKQALQITEFQQEAEKQRSLITELTETISHSSQTATATRDDDYFAGEFARLAGSIRQWVLRYFNPRNAPEFRHQDLPTVITESLEKTVFGYSSIPDSKIKIGRQEIEAVITQRLNALIFNSDFVFKIFYVSFPPTKDFLGVSG